MIMDGHGNGEMVIITARTFALFTTFFVRFRRRLPLPEVEENPNTLLAVTDRGGHVAFVQHLWPFSEAWMDNVAAEFLTPHLEPPHSRL